MPGSDFGFKRVCSECGKEFIVSIPGLYTYKINLNKERTWQCDHNCHNHALLRSNKYTKCIDYEDIVKLIKESEMIMKEKGKTILHPIKYKEIEEKELLTKKPRKNAWYK